MAMLELVRGMGAKDATGEAVTVHGFTRRFGGGRRNVRSIGAKWQNMSWRIDCRTRWKRLIGVARCWRSAGHS